MKTRIFHMARRAPHASEVFFLLWAALAACEKGGEPASSPANASAAAGSVGAAAGSSSPSQPATASCDLSQIGVERLADDESAGHGEHRFSIKNSSRVACSLPRYPLVRLLGSDSKPLGDKIGLTQSQGEDSGPIVLAPGQAAWFALGYTHRGTTSAPACAKVPKIGVGLTGSELRSFDLAGEACPPSEGEKPTFRVTPFVAGSP